MAGMLSDNQWTVQVVAVATQTPLKKHIIAGVPTFEGIKGEELEVVVTVPYHLHHSYLARDSASTINASIKVDGKAIGYSLNLKGGTETQKFNYVVVDGAMKAICLTEPDTIPFTNEAEAKKNIEANKSSPVGTIEVSIWTALESGGSTARVDANIGKPIVPETKKFHQMPSLGISGGRNLGADSATRTQMKFIAEIAKKTIRLQTASMCDLLLRIELTQDIERRKAEKQAAAAGGGSDSDSAVAENPSAPKRRKLAAAAAAAAAEPQITFIDLT